jgi:hypothetical protein
MAKISTSRLTEEIAIFKFDEELALEELRKPKAPKYEAENRCMRYSRHASQHTLLTRKSSKLTR